MCLCEKCSKLFALIVLVLGVLFLLQDLMVWDFWKISWYTVVFLLLGLTVLCSKCCPTCKAKEANVVKK